MNAWKVSAYGGPGVLELVEVPRPDPKDGEILIRVHATTVNSGDRRIRSASVPRGFGPLMPLIFGFGRPRQPVLGAEVAGIVEKVGTGVTRFKAGQKVFAFPDVKMGGHAEYLTMLSEGTVASMPDDASFEQAAALCFGPCTALSFLRRGKVKAGDRVLVNGASGCVGAAAVQLAVNLGAEVTGVTSAGNADLVRSLGATEIIEYKSQDPLSGSTWDVILDTVGNFTFDKCKRALAPGGRLLLVAADLLGMLAAPFQSASGYKVIAGPSGGRREDIELVASLFTQGKYRPVIDSVLSFSDMPEAHRIADSGHKRGSVVVRLNV